MDIFAAWNVHFHIKTLVEAWKQQIVEMAGLGTVFSCGNLVSTICRCQASKIVLSVATQGPGLQ